MGGGRTRTWSICSRISEEVVQQDGCLGWYITDFGSSLRVGKDCTRLVDELLAGSHSNSGGDHLQQWKHTRQSWSARGPRLQPSKQRRKEMVGWDEHTRMGQQKRAAMCFILDCIKRETAEEGLLASGRFQTGIPTPNGRWLGRRLGTKCKISQDGSGYTGSDVSKRIENLTRSVHSILLPRVSPRARVTARVGARQA